MIEAESSKLIRTSREALWRHLTRVSDWYRWYPGLHGTTATETIARPGQSWRSTGQLGRMLYRGDQAVTEYQLLSSIEIRGSRYPWFSETVTRFTVVPDGPNCRMMVTIAAKPGFWLFGRFVLSGMLRRRLQRETDAVAERLSSYVENTMPYH